MGVKILLTRVWCVHSAVVEHSLLNSRVGIRTPLDNVKVLSKSKSLQLLHGMKIIICAVDNYPFLALCSLYVGTQQFIMNTTKLNQNRANNLEGQSTINRMGSSSQVLGLQFVVPSYFHQKLNVKFLVNADYCGKRLYVHYV